MCFLFRKKTYKLMRLREVAIEEVRYFKAFYISNESYIFIEAKLV